MLFLLLVNVADFLGELLQGVLVGAVLQLKICGDSSVLEFKPSGKYPHLAASLKLPPTGSPWWLSALMTQGSESNPRRCLTQKTVSWTRMVMRSIFGGIKASLIVIRRHAENRCGSKRYSQSPTDTGAGTWSCEMITYPSTSWMDLAKIVTVTPLLRVSKWS